MNTVLKVGIVGFGGAGIAQFFHFSNIRNSQVLAIFDPNERGVDRAKGLAPGIIATNNFEEFMSSGINAMAVCSPDRTHADYIVAALNAGMHVVCEKPLTDSLEGCRRILAAERKNPNLVAAVQHQMRFLPVHVEMKKLMNSGQMGRIGYIEGYYVHNLTRRAYQYDDWRSTDNATPLVYSGCHFVDLLRWLLDDEVEEVLAMANNIAFPEYPESDLNVVLLRFRSGVIGKVVVAFGAGRPLDHSVRVYGSERCIENNLLFSKDGGHTVFARPHLSAHKLGMKSSIRTRPLFHIRGHGLGARIRAFCSRRRFYSNARMFERLMKDSCYDQEHGIAAFPIRLYPHTEAVRTSLESFVSAIRGKTTVQCSLKDAARTVATCLAGVEAYRSGRLVKAAEFWLPELD